MVVLPTGLADRAERRRLDGQAAEDSTGADCLELTLGILSQHTLGAWLEMPCQGVLPGLPAAGDPEALQRGLVRVDEKGLVDDNAYWPLNPDVQAALKQRLTQTLEPRQRHANLLGLLIRMGTGTTLLGAA